MKIEVLLTETEIADEFYESIEARDLPEKFFYWTPLSARIWTSVVKSPPLESLRQMWRRIGTKAESVVEHVGGPISVVSLGAGDGAQDESLLNGLIAARPEVRYYPVDASQPLLESACARAEDAEIETLGLKADISSPSHLVVASDTPETAKIFLLAGNTLGAFDPFDMLRNVAQCMRAEDRLIVDGMIFRDDVLATVDSPLGRKFAFAPLLRIGFQETDGKLRFELKRDLRHEGLYLVTRSFHVERDLSGILAAGEISVQRGERIAMNFSYAYTPEAFRWLIEEQAKLKILQEYQSPFHEFVAAVCARES
jgi:uncharacterized SAM-dependent methyltransferase